MKRAWTKSTKGDVNQFASSIRTNRYSIIYQHYLRVKREFLILSLVLIIISFIGCSKSDTEALILQGINLEGNWGITECAYVTQGGTQKILVNEIKNGQAVTDFFFMKEGKFKQTSNMSGSGNMETYEGTWKITGAKLIITLLVNGNQADVDYTCEQKSDLLILTRKSPDGSMSIVNTFKKKG